MQVRVRDSLSDSVSVASGVPQGSVIGPLLFIIYTSEIPKILSSYDVECRQFADDLKIFISYKSGETNEQLAKACKVIQEYSDMWQLPINIDKTCIIHLGRRNPCLPIAINGCPIQPKVNVRDLGIIIDKDLSFSAHCATISRKAMAAAHLIFRVLRTKNKNILLRAYEIYVRPMLEFASTVYSPYKKKDIQTIERVQNFVTRKIYARCVSKDGALPTPEERNRLLNLTDLRTRREDLDTKMLLSLIFNFKSLSDKIPHHYNIKPSRLRGPGFTLFHSTPNSSARKNSFFIRSSIAFNKKSRAYPHLVPRIATD